MTTRLPPDIPREDIQQWLEGTYYWVELETGRELCAYRSTETVHNTREDRRQVVVSSEGMSEGNTILCSPADILLEWPRLGALNTGPFAVYLERVPRRQWKRGFNVRDIQIVTPMMYAVRKQAQLISTASLHNNFLIRRIFEPTYCTLDEARDLLAERESLSVAVSRQIILGAATGDVGARVFYRGKKAGLLDENWREFTPNQLGEQFIDKIIKHLGGNVSCRLT